MRSVLFVDGSVNILVFLYVFSLVARVATLENSGDLNKSKMAPWISDGMSFFN